MKPVLFFFHLAFIVFSGQATHLAGWLIRKK